ncbi:4Fe-4S binding protein [Methanobrevibacter filiformis]|uniref:Electron transport complex subunit RsxB n=1 Tax=Methanobrevibacter filiformis TaxID=55758 RepID=A0A166ET11_9EURY|nr:4Fe-4S binding protein [Methanobrevibacter filiformis]KZX16980.1 electron transport complex subunit RsxB [Methanobrevibacter filiformis]
MLQILVDPEKCTACGTCIDACPKGEIIWHVDKIAHANNLEYCHVCTICASKCPEDAILVDRNGPGDKKVHKHEHVHGDDLFS